MMQGEDHDLIDKHERIVLGQSLCKIRLRLGGLLSNFLLREYLDKK